MSQARADSLLANPGIHSCPLFAYFLFLKTFFKLNISPFIDQVPTAEGSAPAESLLASPSMHLRGQYWRAPSVGTTAVDIAIVLATPGNVHRLALEVSPCGYTQGHDTPLVRRSQKSLSCKKARFCHIA